MSLKKLEIKNLVCSFKDSFSNEKIIINDISYKFHLNKITAIIGEPGSGKSFLLKHINILIAPKSGSITIDEFTWSKKMKIKKIEKLRKKIGYIFQFSDQQLFEETVEKDILFSSKNFKLDLKNSKKIAKKYFKYLSLKNNYFKRSPFQLSGGEKKKVAIISSLAHDPDLIILDEIANGLDVQSTKKIVNLIKDLKEKFNKTILFTTNDMEMVYNLADIIIILKDGKIVKKTTPKDFFFNKEEVSFFGLSVPKTVDFLIKLENNKLNIEDLKEYSSEDELILKIVEKFSNKKNEI